MKNSRYDLTNVINKKVQRAFENVLAGAFLSPGSGLLTPRLDQGTGASILFLPLVTGFTKTNGEILTNFFLKKNYITTVGINLLESSGIQMVNVCRIA